MKKVLLVEDDNAIAEVYVRGLKEAGFEVFRASNGEEGIAMASEKKPDLILMDVLMPKMTGPEAMIKLKANEETRGIPAIFLTNLEGEAETARFAVEIGASEYLIKNDLSIKDLVAKVKKHLGIKE